MEANAGARPLSEEKIRFFEERDVRDLFEQAREARFIGAASYDAVLADAAPYVYAARFARDKRVAIRDPHGALGAAMLARHAVSIQADLGADNNAAAHRWFGKDLFRRLDGEHDVDIAAKGTPIGSAPVRLVLDAEQGERVVRVATPVPSEIMVSFDPDDAPPVRSFAVECDVRRPGRGTRGGRSFSQGGSSGRVLILVRDDARRSPDSDVEDADELARLLSGEGFAADVRAASTAVDPASYDLVHAFVGMRPGEFWPALSAARRDDVPIVVTACIEDVAVQGVWGSGIVPVALSMSAYEAQLAANLDMLEARRLEADGLHPQYQEPFAQFGAALREVYALASAVIVSGPEEEALLRRYAYTGPVSYVQAYANTMIEPAPVEHLCGTSDYALLHGPVEGRSNQFMAVRAAVANDVPLVLAGPINDASYYHALMAWGNERVLFVPNPSQAELAGLYRGARVFLDVAWIRYGLRRIAQAALSGCALVAASRGYAPALWRPGLMEADPGSERGITRALGDAWFHALERRADIDACAERVAAACDPRAALVATVQAYADVSAPRVGA